ncbi:cytochrome c [Deinococcus sp.]|uniref:c-type cytochrome n=1 Tax=Deinococcus sp. TaxID=47478 RepID=UPI002869E304|nr:cytochrome c [Deinococcus sp.]
MLRSPLLPALLIPLCALAAAQATPDSPAAGMATPRDAQVQRGEVLYLQVCAICRGDHRQGLFGPALGGPDFLATFGGGQVAALHTVIATTMPEDRPGSLSAQEVLDVTAYLLDASDLPHPDGVLDAPVDGAAP